MRHRCTQNGGLSCGRLTQKRAHLPCCLLPALLFLPSRAPLEASARGTSGAKERLARVPSGRKNNSKGRHNASSAAWLTIPKGNEMRLAHHLPLIQQTSGVNVTASLGRG